MKENSVESFVRNYASKPLDGRLNLVQYKAQKAKDMAHKSVCEQVSNFADLNPSMPFYAILSVGVGTGAFKMSEYKKGYKTFDAEKASVVKSMAEYYTTATKGKGKPTDIAWRLTTRYYNRKSHSLEDFKADVDNASKKIDSNRGHFPMLCEALGIK